VQVIEAPAASVVAGQAIRPKTSSSTVMPVSVRAPVLVTT